jgi:cell division protein FtsI (penicillin-binding protein 3)
VPRAHEEKPQITTGQEKLLKAGLALPPATVATETSQPLAASATNEPVHPPGSVVVQVEGGPVVPDFTGKSMRGAIELAQQSGVALNAMGSGIAREQSPPAGTHVTPHATVVVRFAR